MNSAESAPPPGATERPLTSLLSDLAGELTTLVRQEVGVGKAEAGRVIGRGMRDVAGAGIAAAVVAGGVLVLSVCLVVVAGMLLGSYWLGALVVALLLLAAGAVGAWAAVQKLATLDLAPSRTLETLQRTGEWARAEVADVRSTLLGTPPGRATASARTTAPHPVAEARKAGGRSGEKSAQREGGLLKRTFHEISEDEITGQAAKLAYYAFMSMAPALMVIFALTGIFGGQRTATYILDRASQVIPPDAFDVVGRFISEVVDNNAPGPLSIGLLLALWSASTLFTSLATTLNVAYDVEETRPFWKQRLIAIGMMMAFVVLLFGSSLVLLGGSAIADGLGLGGVGKLIWQILQWPIAIGFVVGAFWLAYYFLPNRDQSRVKVTLLKASAVATAIWALATIAFKFYVSNFSSYTASYGFLGAFIVLLLWMYVTGIAVLVGGELAAEMEAGA